MTDAPTLTLLAFALFLLPFAAVPIAGAWAIFSKFRRPKP